MNDASLQIGQPIRANPSPSSVSCIEMHGSLSKLRNGPHFRPDDLARQETSEAHPACLPSTARRRSLPADSLEKMTIAVMVQTTDPLSPGTFESRPPDDIRRDVGGGTIWTVTRRALLPGNDRPTLDGWMEVAADLESCADE